MPEASGGSILGDIVEWFLGRCGDRLQYKRRAGTLHLYDAYQLLPMAVGDKIVEMLVSKHRIDRPQAGQTPCSSFFTADSSNAPARRGRIA